VVVPSNQALDMSVRMVLLEGHTTGMMLFV